MFITLSMKFENSGCIYLTTREQLMLGKIQPTTPPCSLLKLQLHKQDSVCCLFGWLVLMLCFGGGGVWCCFVLGYCFFLICVFCCCCVKLFFFFFLFVCWLCVLTVFFLFVCSLVCLFLSFKNSCNNCLSVALGFFYAPVSWITIKDWKTAP